ncbi:putative extracellular matrix protein [Diaporthe ampelina]|uniref:Putative extracellular matrix protein n=1 Tax=Diaporthe ampelina TaxID=1214573 RepID=A0A0G2FWU0_9PEZI|nr:putative extracellular matrix protein [Diaporthe ampelina]
MKFTAGFLAVVAAAAPAWAIQLTNSAYVVEAGKPFTLTWSDSEGPVTVTLKNGASTDLQDVEVLASGLTTDSFTWTPSSSLPSDTYAFEVTDSSSNSPNYSPQFTFQGSAATASSAASSSVSSTSSASVSTTLSSLTITSSSASATASANSSSTITSTASGNSTATSSSSSSTRTSTRTSSTASDSSSTSTSTPVNTNDSQKLGSPLALILGTLVSLMIFN